MSLPYDNTVPINKETMLEFRAPPTVIARMKNLYDQAVYAAHKKAAANGKQCPLVPFDLGAALVDPEMKAEYMKTCNAKLFCFNIVHKYKIPLSTGDNHFFSEESRALMSMNMRPPQVQVFTLPANLAQSYQYPSTPVHPVGAVGQPMPSYPVSSAVLGKSLEALVISPDVQA